ncbi:hypothetical protein FXO37_17481 [Capsicum annuum]|nr:hypothetical protein FXO37_17481 [Capsicum annuum]
MSDVLYRVLIGRSVIYGLTIKGESGLKQVIEMRKNELELPMALAVGSFVVCLGENWMYLLWQTCWSNLGQTIIMSKNEAAILLKLLSSRKDAVLESTTTERKHWTGEILREGSRTGLRPTRNQRVQPPHGSDPTKDFEKQPSSFPSLPGPKAEIHTLTPEIP